MFTQSSDEHHSRILLANELSTNRYPAKAEESFRIVKRTIVDYDDDDDSSNSDDDLSIVDYSPPSPIIPAYIEDMPDDEVPAEEVPPPPVVIKIEDDVDVIDLTLDDDDYDVDDDDDDGDQRDESENEDDAENIQKQTDDGDDGDDGNDGNDGNDGDAKKMSVIEKAEEILKQRNDGVYSYNYFMTYECQENVRKTMNEILDVFDEKLESVVDQMDIFSQAYERVSTENKNLRKRILKLEEENSSMSKRVKTFTRIRLPFGVKPPSFQKRKNKKH